MKRRMRLRKRFILRIKDKIFISFILVFLVTFIIFRLVNREVKCVLVPYLENDMKRIGMQIINNSILDNKNEENYFDLVITSKNKNDEIISVDFDTLKVNKLLNNLNNSILKDLRDLESGSVSGFYSMDNHGVYRVPFFTFSNNIILKNLGFKMPFKVKIVGNSVSNIKTELSSYGINNALIKMYIEVSVNLQVILPFTTEIVNISNQVPVMMKIINGSIPEVYGGMYSVNSHSV